MPISKRVRYKDLRIAQLRSFCEVCRLGSFAAAAQALHLTTPAVWEQVRALESHYGVRLLTYRDKSVHLTTEGATLLGLLRPLLAALDSTGEVIRQHGGALPERINVGSSLRVQMNEILRAMRHFQRRYPTVDLGFRHVDSAEVAALLNGGDADLAVMLKPGPADPAGATLCFEPIAQLDFLLVVPPGHDLMTRGRLRLEDILRHPLVLGRPNAFSRRRFEEVLHAHDLDGKARVAMETSNGSVTLAAVREGLGVGIVACTARGILTEGLDVRPLRRWFGTAQVVLARKPGEHIPPVHRELAQAIRRSIAKGLGREALDPGGDAPSG